MNIQLISPDSATGFSANWGAFYPYGLVSLAGSSTSQYDDLQIWIDDQQHGAIKIRREADIVGIQSASSLSHPNAIEFAHQAKQAGKIVVLGGAHATALPQQIMHNRLFVDFLIRGKGEMPFNQLIEALNNGRRLDDVESLSWRRGNQIIHNKLWPQKLWRPREHQALEFLSAGAGTYFETFRRRIYPPAKAAIIFFSHTGCKYKNDMFEKDRHFCSFCTLDDPLLSRAPESVIAELENCFRFADLKPGDVVVCKDYGDNIGCRHKYVRDFRKAVERCSRWSNLEVRMTAYCQSSLLTQKLAKNLAACGVTDLFFGLDSADDEVQRLNFLGTSLKTHERALRICRELGIEAQISLVNGLIGDTAKSLQSNLRFCEEQVALGGIGRINAGMIIINPRSLVFDLLAEKEPRIRELDLWDPDMLRKLWLMHGFCPGLSLDDLYRYTEAMNALSPGPKGSMGYNKRIA